MLLEKERRAASRAQPKRVAEPCYGAYRSGISRGCLLRSDHGGGDSLAKKLNGMHELVVALTFGAVLGHFERNPTEVERLASELIESSRVRILCVGCRGEVLRGWARSAMGDTAEGVSLAVAGGDR